MSVATLTGTDDRAPHAGGRALCSTCHTRPPLRGGPYCDQCHPLSCHDAYRRFLCRDCRSTRYSAGRTRCDQCHTDFFAASTTGQPPDHDSPRQPATRRAS